MDIYNYLAKDYDIIYNDQEDIEFYLIQAQKANGPILEIACGTGRILLNLLEKGLDITGIDISSEMLKILQQKAKQRNLTPKIFQCDMSEFNLNKKFNLIIVPYRSLLHLSNENKEKALKKFKDHLSKNGKLIIHTYNPTNKERMMTDKHHLIDSSKSNGGIINWYFKYLINNSGEYKIEIKGKECHVYSMILYFIENNEFEKILRSIGFINIQKYSDFCLNKKENSNEVIWIVN